MRVTTTLMAIQEHRKKSKLDQAKQIWAALDKPKAC